MSEDRETLDFIEAMAETVKQIQKLNSCVGALYVMLLKKKILTADECAATIKAIQTSDQTYTELESVLAEARKVFGGNG